jgi:hypothetical protein
LSDHTGQLSGGGRKVNGQIFKILSKEKELYLKGALKPKRLNVLTGAYL